MILQSTLFRNNLEVYHDRGNCHPNQRNGDKSDRYWRKVATKTETFLSLSEAYDHITHNKRQLWK